MKECRTCGVEQPLSEYGVVAAKYRRGQCNNCRREVERLRRESDGDRCRAVDRARYHNNPRRQKEMKRRAAAWNKQHPEAMWAKDARRRARKAASPRTETINRLAILERDGGRCHICGRKVGKGFHLDHLIPLSKGGPHTAENLRVAHPRCNLTRGAGRLPAQLLLVA